MKLYCKLENNNVVEGPRLLPIELELLSDFDLLDKGWFIAERVIPESIDHATETWVISYEIKPYKVIVYFNKRAKTAEELSMYNLEQLNLLQTMKDSLLGHANNVIDNEIAENIDDWVAYRNTLNNIVITDTMNYQDIIIPPSPNIDEKSTITS